MNKRIIFGLSTQLLTVSYKLPEDFIPFSIYNIELVSADVRSGYLYHSDDDSWNLWKLPVDYVIPSNVSILKINSKKRKYGDKEKYIRGRYCGTIYYNKKLCNKDDIDLLQKNGWDTSSEDFMSVDVAIGKILGYSYPGLSIMPRPRICINYVLFKKQLMCEIVPDNYDIEPLKLKRKQIEETLSKKYGKEMIIEMWISNMI